jgi:hypothetical protein
MDFIAQVKKQYGYINDNDIKRIVDKAKMFYYGAMFPCEPYVSENTRPFNTFFAQQWVFTACEELIERLGFNSAVGYKENGISWTFDGAQISDRLMGLIKPTVGVIK